jgi:uncharacterized tellurite resistance protein B-like protein
MVIGFIQNLFDPQGQEMSAFDARVSDVVVEGIEGWKIEIKGLFPITRGTNCSTCISVLDVTDEAAPVVSLMEDWSEPDSTVFQQLQDIGFREPNYGFPDWAQVGGVAPTMLVPPKGGERDLLFIVRFINTDNPPLITFGVTPHEPDGVSLFAQIPITKTFFFTEKGYEEETESRDKTRETTLKLGVCVANADGSIDDKEGIVIKKWATDVISIYSDDKQKTLKEKYNRVLRDAFQAARKNELALSVITAEMNDIASTQQKYEAIELCYEIMAADGVADAKELLLIKKVSESLELDHSEIERIRDLKLVGLEANTGTENSIEDILGIDPDWQDTKVKDYLLEEFKKWNNRVNTLPNGEERDSAQRRLDLIADARKKYS